MKNAISLFFSGVREEFSGARLERVTRLRGTQVKKDDESFVTKGDLFAQDVIMNAAALYLDSPTIVSEELHETYATPQPGKRVVVIDPIDGTENFVCGLPIWGISVCCYLDGRHEASLLGCPELGIWAWSGGLKEARLESRVRGLSSSLTKDEILAAANGFEYRVFGCCVFNMLCTIRGSLCSFENPKGAWPWDILAGLNLALEAGLSVVVEDQKYAGEYLAPDRRYRFKVG
jgi:myo-inositol-1(or 4)-monophosphatase